MPPVGLGASTRPIAGDVPAASRNFARRDRKVHRAHRALCRLDLPCRRAGSTDLSRSAQVRDRQPPSLPWSVCADSRIKWGAAGASNYAGEFHLDITPSIPNPGCPKGGVLVPDKAQQAWTPSNPKGYKTLFLEWNGPRSCRRCGSEGPWWRRTARGPSSSPIRNRSVQGHTAPQRATRESPRI
jgi:hypothetical protein